jgi:hypothetical protein
LVFALGAERGAGLATRFERARAALAAAGVAFSLADYQRSLAVVSSRALTFRGDRSSHKATARAIRDSLLFTSPPYPRPPPSPPQSRAHTHHSQVPRAHLRHVQLRATPDPAGGGGGRLLPRPPRTGRRRHHRPRRSRHCARPSGPSPTPSRAPAPTSPPPPKKALFPGGDSSEARTTAFVFGTWGFDGAFGKSLRVLIGLFTPTFPPPHQVFEDYGDNPSSEPAEPAPRGPPTPPPPSARRGTRRRRATPRGCGRAPTTPLRFHLSLDRRSSAPRRS